MATNTFTIAFPHPDDPDGSKRKYVYNDYEAESPEQLYQQLQAQGLNPLSYTMKALPGTVAQTTGGAPTPPSQPGTPTDPTDTGANMLSTAGQVGLPLLLAGTGLATGGVPLALSALAGGLGGAALGRGGWPTGMDVANVVAGEVLPPLMRRGAAAGGALVGRGAGLIGRGVSGMAERAGVDLSAWQRFPGLLSEWFERAVGVPGKLAERQEVQAGERAVKLAREAGPIMKNPDQQAFRMIGSIRRTIGKLAGSDDPAVKAKAGSVLRDIKTIFGKPLDNITTTELRKAIRTEPMRVKNLLTVVSSALGAGSGASAEQELSRLWFTDVLHGAVKVPRAGTPGMMRVGGGMVDIDGRVVADAWRAMKATERQAFGSLAKGMEEFTQVVERFPKGERGRLGFTSLLNALRSHKSPTALTAILGGIAGEEMLRRDTIGQFENHSGAIMAGALSTAALGATIAGSRTVLARLLSNPIGIRLAAASLDMQRRGLPETLVEEGLSRMIGRLGTQSTGLGQGGYGGQPTGLPPIGPASALAQP